MKTTVLTLILAMAAIAEGPAWQALSYGPAAWNTLTGRWETVDNVLIGRAAPGEMAWTICAHEYADFELELEFKTPRECNGGVQIRSHWLPKLPIPQDVAAADAPKQMYGYQANIETRKKDGTATVVDENGRGVLVAPSPEAQEVVKPTDWNRMHITAIGPVIAVAVNGVVANRLYDESMIKGFIALQVMPMDGEPPAEIHYRNIRVKDLGRTGPWRPLFDGRSLDGWVKWGAEEWVVEDGAIIGRSGPKKSEGYLATEEIWKDFRVRASFKMLGEGNYGLFYHSTIKYDDKQFPIISGVQGEVAPGYPSPTGWHYESYRRGWLGKPDMSRLAAYALRPGEWNEIEIRCIGNRTTSWVNGIQATDFYDASPQLFEGGFALQLHTGGVDGIAWKDLHVLEGPVR